MLCASCVQESSRHLRCGVKGFMHFLSRFFGSLHRKSTGPATQTGMVGSTWSVKTTARGPDGMPPIAMRNPLRIGPGATRQILPLLRPQFSLETAPGYRSACRLAMANKLHTAPQAADSWGYGCDESAAGRPSA